MKTIATGLCVLMLLSACAVYKDKQGQTHYEVLPPPQEVTVVHAPPPPPPPAYYYAPAPPPPPPAYYYAPPPPPAVIYERRGGGYNPEHDRSKRVQANCNTVWTGCANNCNTIANATQRAVCIGNCNHSRDLCIKKGLGY